MDLAPARWIWFPSQRTLACTFVLFRRELVLGEMPRRAEGWITADSRYHLTVNGQRVRWGPAPSDPRQTDVDAVDLLPFLQPGLNVIGVEVLFYGVGEGTWAGGKPGLLCRFELEHAGGDMELVVSDASWLCCVDRAHPPGQYKRWFLRALQEQFDARLHPHGWDTLDYAPDNRWLPAQLLRGPSDKPAICTGYEEYLGSDAADPAVCALRPREIPPLHEHEVMALRLAESGRVRWLRDPEDWFEFRTPGAFEIVPDDHPLASDIPSLASPSPYHVTPSLDQATYLIFEFAEQIVGWPFFSIDAPEGTIVELITQESHDPARTAWLDSHKFSWARFICRAGPQRLETFEYESLRWLQLHIRRPAQAAASQEWPVTISGVGVRRRVFPWPHTPQLFVDEPALQRLFDATVNTLHNSAQETCVDGMGRERQQYSGDGGHQLRAVRDAFGETRLPRRFLRTFSEGLTVDGYFLDCWPAYDRLARLFQRQTGVAWWGPLLDHGVGFNFDCWLHYMDTGDLDALREPYPRLLRFAAYLQGLPDEHGLLPVLGLGVPTVWIDHDAYRLQRHKQCAFNLYAAAMFRHALAPICRAFGEDARAEHWDAFGEALHSACLRRFWDPERGLFVNNLPWLAQEGAARLCDRSLATALLFDLCLDDSTGPSVEALATCPAEMGVSYPCNALWRYHALARHGRIEVVLRDLRERWATMPSVLLNNTLQEMWQVRPDSADQWSHCPVAPLMVLFRELLGIQPAEPGFGHCTVRPQLGDLGALDVTMQTVRGPIRLLAAPEPGGHRATLSLPPGITASVTAGDETFVLQGGAQRAFFVPRTDDEGIVL